MTKPELSPHDPLDYVIGSLEPTRLNDVEIARTLSNDMDQTIVELEAGLIPLFISGPEIEPPDSVWAAIEAKLDTVAPHQGQLDIDRYDEGIWASVGEGVRSKMLWDGRSVLIECQAGASIAPHDHWAEERVLVLNGDVCFGGRCYMSGDAISMKRGTHHGLTTTKSGCLFMLSYVN